jgi:7,8-dihydropterin-6-yl-methyl-4-(beta-D-ribofuranosyl)aminobenzene 5'-phosphate synthase
LELDYLLLSHGHWDHTWGLDELLKLYLTPESPLKKRPILVAHPLALLPKFRDNGTEHGAIIDESILKRRFINGLSKDPVWLTANLVYLGEIERKIERGQVMGKTVISGVLTDDYILDDTALVYKHRQGLVIITGCSHSGICNIVRQAQKICREDRVYDIVGGFHLLNPDPGRLQTTVSFFKNLNPGQLHPCHCTDLESKFALRQVATVKEVGCGLQLDYD